jgi:putative ABC transport system ATP-binding protein
MTESLRATDLHKAYRRGREEVHALRGASIEVASGELVALLGRSGSGKTTLLNLIGGLDAPESGRVVVGEHEVSTLGEAGLQRMRRETVGFVFQSFGLIPVLSAAENVGVALRLTRTPAREREERVRLLLAMVGLADHARQRPYELSGGQQQRVAIARAPAPGAHRRRADRAARLRDGTVDHAADPRGRPRPGRDGRRRHPRPAHHPARRPGHRAERRHTGLRRPLLKLIDAAGFHDARMIEMRPLARTEW